MRISLPLYFWVLLTIKLDHTDAFTPSNLLSVFGTPRYSPAGMVDVGNNKHDAYCYPSRASSLQRLRAADDRLADDDSNGFSNIPETPKIRAAYLQWCEKYKKKPDESRYPQFVNNFNVMESIAKRGGGKAMHLNEFADFTGEEYQMANSSYRD